HLRRLVSRRLPDRSARQSDRHLSRGRQEGGRGGTRARDRDAGADQCAGQQGDRGRVLRRQEERQGQDAPAPLRAPRSAHDPRVLLHSASDKHGKGLANSRGLVGKYLMAHFASGTWALFDEDLQNHMGTTGSQFMSYDRYGKTSQKGAFGSSFIVAGSAQKT